jgi:hypothetical protein
VAPVSPVAPVAPVGPVSPVPLPPPAGPVGPVTIEAAPVGPAAPVFPVGPTDNRLMFIVDPALTVKLPEAVGAHTTLIQSLAFSDNYTCRGIGLGLTTPYETSC